MGLSVLSDVGRSSAPGSEASASTAGGRRREKAEVAGRRSERLATRRAFLECRGQVEAFVIEALGVMHQPQAVASEAEEGLRRRCIHAF